MKKQAVVAALGAALSWNGGAQAQEPRRFPKEPETPAKAAAHGESFNQRMANAITMYLRASGHFGGCNVHVTFTNGVAEIAGQVNDMQQRAEALHIIRSVPGVAGVFDRLIVGAAPANPVAFAPAPAMAMPMPASPAAAYPVTPAQALDGPKGMPEPLSIMPMPMAGMPNPAYNPPPMPPYAWPSYAPYNNVSRVAYPTEYPYEAWPYIGPMYPFPKIPPGWRSVTLRWEDGSWFYGRSATGHDWWRVRYW